VSRHLFLVAASVAALMLPLGAQQPAAQSPPAEPSRPFEEWLTDVIAEARTRGFADPLLETTIVGLEPLPRVIESDRSQAEFTPDFNRYMRTRLTRTMTTRGKEAAQRRFVLAIWGLESRFGRDQGSIPVFQALATLAWEPRRATFFRGELFNALTMVDKGFIEAPTMKGSWAGAMGQTQFMPSSYLNYAVDFDADGRRDIWGSTPDALASIANYLKGFGWKNEHTWGREVRVSDAVEEKIAAEVPRRKDGCSAHRGMTERRPLDEWRKLGVRRSDGGPLPSADVTAGLLDVGGRTFLVYPNYDAILGYNCANFYALSVALVGDSFR
jgi:membrane-bound lytic murein transglycosylase B